MHHPSFRFDGIRGVRQCDVIRRYASAIVRGQTERDLREPDIDVRVVIGGLGDLRDPIYEGDRLHETGKPVCLLNHVDVAGPTRQCVERRRHIVRRESLGPHRLI